jgi:flagellar basal body-associated protein FliL
MPEDEEKPEETKDEEEPTLKLFTRKGLILMIVLLVVEAVVVIGVGKLLQKEDKVPSMPDITVRPSDPIVSMGEHSITTQSKDGAQVILKFELSLVGFEDFRKECFDRTSDEGVTTYVADLVTYSMQKLIQESTVTEITLDAIKQRLMRDLIDTLNDSLKKEGDSLNIKFFKAVLIHKLMIQSG